MTVGEALVKLGREKVRLKPEDACKPSRVNPSFTRSEVIDIVADGIIKKPTSERLSRLLEKRVLQVIRNQRRPRF